MAKSPLAPGTPIYSLWSLVNLCDPVSLVCTYGLVLSQDVRRDFNLYIGWLLGLRDGGRLVMSEWLAQHLLTCILDHRTRDSHNSVVNFPNQVLYLHQTNLTDTVQFTQYVLIPRSNAPYNVEKILRLDNATPFIVWQGLDAYCYRLGVNGVVDYSGPLFGQSSFEGLVSLPVSKPVKFWTVRT